MVIYIYIYTYLKTETERDNKRQNKQAAEDLKVFVTCDRHPLVQSLV